MNRYPSYKPTGVKWLGEIPSHWRLVKSKYLWKESFATSENGNEELLSVSQYDGITPAKGDSRSESLKGYKIVSENDLVINIMLAWMGGLGVSNYNGIVSPAYCIYKLNDDSNPKFLHYLYKTPLYLAEFARHSTGVIPSRWRMYTDDFGQVLSLIPPREEQDAIVSYLDERTAKIDAAIAQQQKMIDLLNERKQIIINRAVTKGLNPNAKMKDSGVEWIGVIPEKWEVCALKHYCLLTNGDRGPNYPSGEDIKDSGVLFATADNIHGLRIEVKDGTKYITKEKYNTLRGAKMRKGDIVFCLRGAGFGNCAINDLFDEGTIASSLVNITPLNIDCEFMNYVLHSAYIRMQEIFSSNGSCADNVSAQDLGDYLIVVPPKDDQKKIVNAITSTILPIDRLIKNTNNQISLLQERKQIIINEVVTGKVKVG